MDTATAIIITQLPIAVVILLGVFELYKLRKEFNRLLKKIDFLRK